MTSRLIRSGLGSSRARAASTARSAQSSFGFGFCRRSTATSWRSTSSSASFDGRRTREQHHPAGQADEHQVEHPYGHKPAILPAQRPLPQANPQVSHLCPVLEPHREVWEENEFWIELSWRIDPDGCLGIRQYHESRACPGEKLTVDEYYGWMFENSVPGLPERAAAEGLTPLQWMRRYGAFEIT